MSETAEPIFIVGVQHSGTTILCRMLARHPDLAWFSQYSLRNGEIPGRKRLPFAGPINRTLRRLLPVPWRKSQRRLSALAPTPKDSDIWKILLPQRKIFLDAEDNTPALSAAVRDIARRECVGWRKPRLLVKLPELARAVLLLDAIFPGAKFVHIVRDGKAVAPSLAPKFAGTPYGPGPALLQAAAYWRDVMQYWQRCEKDIPDRVMTLRYEKLCDDVRGSIEEVLRFCDLPVRDFPLQQLPATIASTNAKRIAEYTPEERRQLDGILSATLASLDYEPFFPEKAGPSSAPAGA